MHHVVGRGMEACDSSVIKGSYIGIRFCLSGFLAQSVNQAMENAQVHLTIGVLDIYGFEIFKVRIAWWTAFGSISLHPVCTAFCVCQGEWACVFAFPCPILSYRYDDERFLSCSDLVFFLVFTESSTVLLWVC